jgi:hypothetical protein
MEMVAGVWPWPMPPGMMMVIAEGTVGLNQPLALLATTATWMIAKRLWPASSPFRFVSFRFLDLLPPPLHNEPVVIVTPKSA